MWASLVRTLDPVAFAVVVTAPSVAVVAVVAVVALVVLPVAVVAALRLLTRCSRSTAEAWRVVCAVAAIEGMAVVVLLVHLGAATRSEDARLAMPLIGALVAVALPELTTAVRSISPLVEKMVMAVRSVAFSHLSAAIRNQHQTAQLQLFANRRMPPSMLLDAHKRAHSISAQQRSPVWPLQCST